MTLSYQSPLVTRYSSKVMNALFSEKERALMFRRLWILLAEIEKDLGLPISKEAIEEMKEELYNPHFERIAHFEEKLSHDVMAHIEAFAEACPKAAGIIHLGATSCYVTDNADILIYKKGLDLLLTHYKTLIESLMKACQLNKEVVCVGYTHFQIAQPTTMGKRMSLWLQDLWHGYLKLKQQTSALKLLGVKGATGTQSSFYVLFDGDEKKVEQLEAQFSEKLQMPTFAVSGQTYSRLQDLTLLHLFAEIATSLHKMGTDIRLLCHTGELKEAFSPSQVGSSAMPHKKNPMLSERLCSLARFLMQQTVGAAGTHATQWLERSLDDSAIRRMIMPESFLCLDALLSLACKIINGLHVDQNRCKHLFMDARKALFLEPLLMKTALMGQNRQKMHADLKAFYFAHTGAFDQFLQEAKEKFHLDDSFVASLKEPSFYTALCPKQVDRFLSDVAMIL